MIEENSRPVLCQCPTCHSVFSGSREVLEVALQETVELDGGTCCPLEDIEELRLTLKSFMRPEVLQALVDILDAIDTEPKQTEMFAWFARNSTYGKDCRFALMALKKFKEQRLDRVKELVAKAAEVLNDI